MDRRRIGIGVLSLLTVALLFAVDPVAAQSANNDIISDLNQELLFVGVPITLFVEGILIYTVWRYRNNENPTPTRENRRLEITWTIATALILLFVGVAAYQAMGSPLISLTSDNQVAGAEPGQSGQQLMDLTQPLNASTDSAVQPGEANAVQIEVIAYQWGWEFHYPNGKVSQTTLAMPTDRPVYLHVTARDVIHAVHVPTMGLKQDAIPGQYNTLKARSSEPGTHQLYCAEFCGSGHAAMLAEVDVLPQQQYQQWLSEGQGSGSGSGSNGSNASSTNGSNSSNVGPAGSLAAPA